MGYSTLETNPPSTSKPPSSEDKSGKPIVVKYGRPKSGSEADLRAFAAEMFKQLKGADAGDNAQAGGEAKSDA
jgi:hypothetical protein